LPSGVARTLQSFHRELAPTPGAGDSDGVDAAHPGTTLFSFLRKEEDAWH
jgi:hypothetical protein